MKRIQLLILALVPAMALAKGEKQIEKSLPAYEITKTVVDPALSKTEAVFDFNFVIRNGKVSPMRGGSVGFSANGMDQTATPNAKGNYVFKTKPGKYVFQFYFNENHHEVVTDSIAIGKGVKTSVTIYFDYTRSRVVAEKPVIYLYPTQTTEVSVTLDINGSFLYTYPAYKNGWTVTANPDGKLQQGDNTYNYLFWEGTTSFAQNLAQEQTGFVLETEGLTGFFEEKLGAMGLNSTEIQDFITYWVPRMQKHDKHLVYFMWNKEYDQYAHLNVQPQPDQMIRIFMLWSPLEKDQNVSVKEQTLPQFNRHGFTLVEWGGAEVEFQNIVSATE